MKVLRLLAAGALAALMLSGVPASAAPGDELRWAVQPSSAKGPDGRAAFDLKGAPGQQFADYVGVSNLDDKDITVTLYATDAFTAADGAFALLTAAERPRDLGSWVDLQPRQYVIPAGKRIDVPFRLTVPANATPGDHAAGIIASVAGVQTAPDGKQVNVDKRVAARVYLRVDGPVRPAATITSVQAGFAGGGFASGDLTVTYLVRNTGNVRVAGTAKIRVRGPLGVGLGGSEDITVPELLPGAELTMTRKVTGVFAAGWVDALVTFNPHSLEGQLPGASRSGSAWAPPWLVLGALAAVAGVVLLIRWVRRRRRFLEHVAAQPA
ncbi:WxL protein peptidoglycan domain-containing protein [Longispora albida]|uniref:WxL protein peptidoglycan domain-containing protein n=1 Tax=Longispora albida TaxID=203523 RepID=UPI000375B994|nr:DUF916 domain-containing protein [Longispora albida]